MAASETTPLLPRDNARDPLNRTAEELCPRSPQDFPGPGSPVKPSGANGGSQEIASQGCAEAKEPLPLVCVGAVLCALLIPVILLILRQLVKGGHEDEASSLLQLFVHHSHAALRGFGSQPWWR
mmetsp:Transcript_30570/g.68685  ORF Transcript_30570/g.68685 Transcript_30570/m.68685 type:complete len:124 (+) Transcript_30570:40-411(+)